MDGGEWRMRCRTYGLCHRTYVQLSASRTMTGTVLNRSRKGVPIRVRM